MLLKICENCNKEYKAYGKDKDKNNKRRFCSLECKKIYNSKTNLVECEICHKQFKTYDCNLEKGFGRFCSKKCKGIYFKQSENKKCLTCGKDISVTPYKDKHGYGKYCSKSCFSQAYKKKDSKPCDICGKIITTIPSKLKYKKYCSRNCYMIGFNNRIKKELDNGTFALLRPEVKRKSLSKAGKRKGSNLEKMMWEAIQEYELVVIPQYKIEYVKNKKGQMKHLFLDFAIPELMIDIECDGEYWHNKPEIIKKDAQRDIFLKDRGWKILRFSGKQLQEDINRCISIIVLEIRSINDV